jgi:hypothetical protein
LLEVGKGGLLKWIGPLVESANISKTGFPGLSAGDSRIAYSRRTMNPFRFISTGKTKNDRERVGAVIRKGLKMGEFADGLLNGLCCEVCGKYLDGEKPGYPRICIDCAEDDPEGIDGREVVNIR